ncbi:MAG: hypothetical protein ABMB14_05135 [Myxococcota bacterium]
MGSMIRTMALAVALALPSSSAFAAKVIVTHPRPVVHHTVVVHRPVVVHPTVVRPVVRPVVHVATPVVRINLGFDAWNPRSAPVYRPGYVFVTGHYDQAGFWVPGHYRPVETRTGYVWEDGYWDGGVYVEGYWREVNRPGERWIAGHYTPNRGWVPGHWSR